MKNTLAGFQRFSFTFLPVRVGLAFLLGLLSLAGLVRPALAQDLPPEAYISGFIGHPQSYSLSCESRSAADLAAFWGSPANETQILQALGVSDNPEVNFAGDVNGIWGAIPPSGYGVHAAPIARVLRDFGLPAEDRRGMTWDDARAHLAAGRPILVWIIGAMWAGTPVSYTASDGQTVTVARYEHSMTLVGYSPGLVHVVDSYSGAAQTYSLESFLTSWAVLGNQAVFVTGPVSQPDAPPQEPAAPAPVAGETVVVQRGDTLASLALAARIPWQELAAYNQIAYPYTIYAGQALNLPGQAAQVSEPVEAQNQPVISEPVEPQAEPAEEQAYEPVGEPLEHRVTAGDTLVGLARLYGVTWQAIAEVNGLVFPFFIYPGQPLILPGGSAAQPEPAETQPEEQAAPEAVAVTPLETGQTYRVQPGEYLLDLARRFGMDWQTLADLNSIPYPYTIYPGQDLIIR